MIYVGIDVAKSKHDCCILGMEGQILFDSFTFPNSKSGFQELTSSIQVCLLNANEKEVRVGLEATGHYSTNLVAFLRNSGIEPVLFNPLSTNLFRKSQTLRKTKTDKVDARCIASMLRSANPAPHVSVSYHTDELKALTRSRYRLIGYRSKLKISLNRLLDIVFPELAGLVWSTNQKSVYALLLELPNTNAISHCRMDKLTRILHDSSKGKYGREKALLIRQAAMDSIGSNSPALAFEIRQTIHLIQNVQVEVDQLEQEIENEVKSANTPLLTIPGIGYTLASIILAEIGDIDRFDSPEQLLAFAGLEPSTHQSGNYSANHTPMVKRGSTYLRWAILQAARLVAMRDSTFKAYLKKKRHEGKHFLVALSHTGKKLVRVIFHMLKTNRVFVPQS